MKAKELLPLYAVIFLGFLGFALTLTIFIPMIMDSNYLMLPSYASISLRTSISGFLLAMYPMGQFLGAPVIGKLSSHYGYKKILLISLLLCCLGFLMMALSIVFHQLYILFFSAFFTGLCESNMAISQSIISEKIKDTIKRAKLIGYAYSACSLGYTVGPLVGSTSDLLFGYSSAFWITAVATLALIIWVFYALQEQPVKTAQSSMPPINLFKTMTAFTSLFSDKKLYQYYLLNFAIFFAVQGLYRVVPLYLVDKWAPSLHTYSLLISYVSFICLLANILILPYLVKKIGITRLLACLLISGAIFIVCILIPNSFHWIWLTYGLAVIPTVMALPVCTTLLSKQINKNQQAQVLGNNQALLVLGEALSALVGGVLASISTPLPIAITAIILVICAVKSRKATSILRSVPCDI